MSQSGVVSLFEEARNEGKLSQKSLDLLGNVDIGQAIQDGLGISVDGVMASEVVLVTIMPDDSGSIRFASNAQLVRDGHNLVIDALNKSKQTDSVLMHTRYLNGHVLFPYREISQAIQMDSKNYDPNGGTPLYDQTLVLLGTVLAKSQEFASNGVPVRTVTLIITDGADCSSYKKASDVKSVIKDMLKQENHIVAAMGIYDQGTDFNQVFKEMGILPEWILTPGNTPSEIRKAFMVFSQSAVRASQGAQSFSQVAQAGLGGGFTS